MSKYDPQKLNVCNKRCKECLFSEARIVSADRAAQVIDDCLTGDRWFICHKTNNTCCKGFFDTHKRDVWPIRLALALDGVNFINHDEDKA